MFAHRQASGVTVCAAAKLNLFFEVLGRRSDGYHEVETLMVPISLYDELVFRTEPDGAIHLDCGWASVGLRPANSFSSLPDAQQNLVTRALELLRARSGVRAGASIRLRKRIPMAAGLGGGSSDAAAALLAANVGWQLDWSRESLAELSAELGSDIPFFLSRGPAICRGRGERVEPVGGLGALHFVVVCPAEGLSTAAVYARVCTPSQPRSVAPLIDALRRGDNGALQRGVYNRLEEAAKALSPWIGRLQRELAGLDCLAVQMSGSGTSYFGICRHARHARRVAQRLQSRGVGRAYAVSSSN